MKWLLVVIAIAIGVTAGFFLKTTDSELSAARRDSDALQEQARALAITLGDIRAAQVSYVARGQGEAFWMTRVTKLAPALQEQMAQFKGALISAGAQSDMEPAGAALENFKTLDARAQADVKSNDALMASDLIFSDGLEAINAMSTQIDTALRDEMQSRSASMASLHSREIMIAGGGAAGIMLMLIVLALMPAKARPVVAEVTQPVEEPSTALMPSPSTGAPDSLAAPLADTATLCSDLARVTSSAQLPALLKRAATVLDASGVIVWTVEPVKNDLRPAMTHGYTDQVMARMGAIPRDANNAVAAAFRSGEMKVVAGDSNTNGALVVPLVTADGCVGVLSAEIRGGAENDQRAHALAAILAAQLATLVSPAPASLPKAAEA